MAIPTEIAVSLALNAWSARYTEIDQIEAWYWGKQYEVSGPWQRNHPWGKERDSTGKYVPLTDRAPYDFGVAKAIVDQSTAFLFDEGRAPEIVVDGEDAGAEAAQAWLREVCERVRIRMRMLEASRIGGRARSVFVVFKLVDGEPLVDCHNGKMCEPRFGPDGKKILSVRKQYKAHGKDLAALGYGDLDPEKLYWFRKDFTPEAEIAYFPVEFKEGPWGSPEFIVDEERTVRHSLGFVPGVWMVNLMRAEESFDGIGTYEAESTLTAIHLINRAESQADRAAMASGDPQFVLEVDPEKNDVDPSVKTQTKGGVWVMPGKLSLVEASGTGAQQSNAQADRYRAVVADTTSWPEIDPESIAGKAQSAEALRVLYQSAISFASILRVCYGDDGLVPLCHVILRVLKATAGQTVNLEAFDAENRPVPRTDIPERARIKLEWGPWFAPTALDIQATIASASAAVMGGLLSQQTAVGFVARHYGRDGEEEMKLILAEQEAALKRATGISPDDLTSGLKDARQDGEDDDEPAE